ncbi:MAG: RNA-guided endonuclease InsQ/TnpB family protein [Ktedonobacteraceae bacterium]
MNKTYQFRLYPTKKQQTTLNEWLALCCEVYNAALQERRDAYRVAGVSLGYAHQSAELPGCKQVRPELFRVNSQVVQDAVKRVDRAFAAFFRRCEAGEKAGYPPFRSRFRYDSLTFKQYGNSFSLTSEGKQKGKLILSKIGQVKMVMHRHLSGTPKTAIVKRTPTGKWFVSITCEEVVPLILLPSEEQVGLDVGLKYFAYLSTGEHIENPRFFREEEKALGKAQREFSKAERGTKQQKKQRRVVARIHERIKNRRQNFIGQQVARLLKRFGFIAVEALVVRNMVKNPKLAKSIADAAWSMFFTHLTLKAEEAARCVVKVPPAYTSQTCSECGQKQNIPLSVRVYECPACRLVIDRDHNASLNILAQAVGRHGSVIPEAPGL